MYGCWFSWGSPTSNPWCPYWSDVLMSSDPRWQRSPKWYNGTDLTNHLKLWRKNTGNGGLNPLGFTITTMTYNPWPGHIRKHSWCHPSGEGVNSIYFIVGVDQSGKDAMGLLKINFLPAPIIEKQNTSTNATSAPVQANITVVTVELDGTLSETQAAPTPPVRQLAMATGYTDNNTWLDWMVATALSLNMSNCVACSSARPILFTVPAPLFPC